VTNAQIAQLLIGIARAQRAVATASIKADSSAVLRIIDNLKGESGSAREDVQPSLLSLPSHVMLQLLGAGTAEQKRDLSAWLRQELARLLV